MKKLIIISVACSVAAASLAPCHGQEPVEDIMVAKLGHAQKVLEALAKEDHGTIARSGQELSLLSQAAAWQVLQTPQYQQHSTDFRRSADALSEAGKQKNLDTAALAYVQMTLNCINCHKYVRKVRAARLGPPADMETGLARKFLLGAAAY
jgi:hypothetical protein